MAALRGAEGDTPEGAAACEAMGREGCGFAVDSPAINPGRILWTPGPDEPSPAIHSASPPVVPTP